MASAEIASRAVVRIGARSDPGTDRGRGDEQYVIAHLGRPSGVQTAGIESEQGPPRIDSEQGSPRTHATLLMVADAMGGCTDVTGAANLASIVEQTLRDMPWFGSGTPDGEVLLAIDFERFVVACQLRLAGLAKRAASLSPKLGTTLAAAYLTQTRLLAAHVGDTRAYLVRGATTRRLARDAGAERSTAPLSWIGNDNGLPKPRLSVLPLERGDRVLLCSDGLHAPLGEARLSKLVRTAPTPAAAAETLVAEALSRGRAGSATAVVAFA